MHHLPGHYPGRPRPAGTGAPMVKREESQSHVTNPELKGMSTALL